MPKKQGDRIFGPLRRSDHLSAYVHGNTKVTAGYALTDLPGAKAYVHSSVYVAVLRSYSL